MRKPIAALTAALLLVGTLASAVGAHPTPEPKCDAETYAVVAAVGDAAMAELIASWQVLDTKCVVAPAQAKALIDGQQVVVLGGTRAVPDSAIAGLSVIVRLAGADRVATAKAVIFWIESDTWRQSDAAIRLAEDYMIELVNELRASLSIAPLTKCDQIGVVARRWSKTMADESFHRHNPNFSAEYPAGWLHAAENIASRSKRRHNNQTLMELLFQQFVDSPSHYQAMIDPQSNTIGVGYALNDYEAYVTQNFAHYPTGSGECGQ